MEFSWIILVPILLMFVVPFLFKIEKFEDVEIVEKQTTQNGMFVSYSFLIKVKNNKITLPVCKEVFNQLNKGSIVTLYYNTGDEKVTRYSL